MEEEDPYVKEDEIREKTTEKRWCDTKAMDHTLKPHHMTRTALLIISHAQARMHAKKKRAHFNTNYCVDRRTAGL
jgi:hypothetical protein